MQETKKQKKKVTGSMPGYKGHLLGGFAIYTALLFLMRSLNPAPMRALEFLIFTLAGSLFPDLDIKSKGQIWFYRMLFVVMIILFIQKRYLVIAFVAIVSMIPLVVKHRGLFHDPWFIIGAPLCAAFLTGAYMPVYTKLFLFDVLFFIAGAVSHIVLDRGKRAFF